MACGKDYRCGRHYKNGAQTGYDNTKREKAERD